MMAESIYHETFYIVVTEVEIGDVLELIIVMSEIYRVIVVTCTLASPQR